MTFNPETIVEAISEGGRVRLLGMADHDGWQFFVETDESTAIGLLSDDDAEGLDAVTRSPDARGFEAALALMDHRSPWVRLSPVLVHESFAYRILAAVRRRTRNATVLRRWAKVCAR